MSKPYLSYIPHGINPTEYYKIQPEDLEYKELIEFRNKLFNNKDYEFVILFNNRNIRRKNTSNIILAFNDFCKKYSKEINSKFALVLHTQTIDPNGTDLFAVKNAVCKDYNVIFHEDRLHPKELNFLYNISDVTINVAFAEGFGLSTAESLMAETMIIATVTGGLQDQMGFRDDAGHLLCFTKTWPSNHNALIKTHGDWAIPIYPVVHNLTGSPPTPYIFDDHTSIHDITFALDNVFSIGKQVRDKNGKEGRKFMLSKESKMSTESMCNTFMSDIEFVLNNWTPQPRYEMLRFE